MGTGTHDHVWSPFGTQEGWLAGLRNALRTGAYRIFNDETLVVRARAGDHAAFDAFIARHRTRLYTMAFDSLGTEAKAGDALCEIVASAFRAIDSFGADCTPGTWLYMHGFRVVFRRMNLPPGRYAVENRLVVGGAARRDH